MPTVQEWDVQLSHMAVIFSCLCIFEHGVELCGDKSPGRGEVEEKKWEKLRFKKRNKKRGLPDEMLRKKNKKERKNLHHHAPPAS